jgi:hypothetical protein
VMDFRTFNVLQAFAIAISCLILAPLQLPHSVLTPCLFFDRLHVHGALGFWPMTHSERRHCTQQLLWRLEPRWPTQTTASQRCFVDHRLCASAANVQVGEKRHDERELMHQ